MDNNNRDNYNRIISNNNNRDNYNRIISNNNNNNRIISNNNNNNRIINNNVSSSSNNLNREILNNNLISNNNNLNKNNRMSNNSSSSSSSSSSSISSNNNYISNNNKLIAIVDNKVSTVVDNIDNKIIDNWIDNKNNNNIIINNSNKIINSNSSSIGNNLIILSEDINEYININNSIKDLKNLYFDLINILYENKFNHKLLLKRIIESNHPTIYKISEWYLEYGINENYLLDMNSNEIENYIIKYVNLYIKLYYINMLRIWNYVDDEIKYIKVESMDYFKKYIKEVEEINKNEIYIIKESKKNGDIFKIEYYDYNNKIFINNKLLPVFVYKINGILYFNYYSELINRISNIAMIKEICKKNSDQMQLYLKIDDNNIIEIKYNFILNLKKTIISSINYIGKEKHYNGNINRVECNSKIKELFIYPIYAIEENLLKRILIKLNKNKDLIENITNYLEKLKI